MEGLAVIYNALMATTLFMAITGFMLFVFWVWMLIDCIFSERFKGSEKPVWLIVLLMANALGAIVYYLSNIRKFGDRRKSIIAANLLFALVSMTGIIWLSALYILPSMVNDNLRSELSKINNSTLGNVIPKHNRNIYSASTLAKNSIEIQKAEKKIVSVNKVKTIKSKRKKGNYSEFGRWRNNKYSEKGIIAILDYDNEFILIESFDSGIQMEHSIVRKIGESSQQNQFLNPTTECNYFVDDSRNLIVWDSLGLKEIFKPI